MNAVKNKSWLTWLVLALITLALVAIAYLIFRPVPLPPENVEQSSTQTETTNNTLPAEKNLQQALEQLAEQYNVAITLDNPFMEDCPYPADLEQITAPKAILRQLCRRFNMELHEPAPGEYLLIGGTCE